MVLDAIKTVYPQFIDGVNVLNTGLNNMERSSTRLTLLNAGWIEATHGDYQFYIDGVTPRWRVYWRPGSRTRNGGLELGNPAQTVWNGSKWLMTHRRGSA